MDASSKLILIPLLKTAALPLIVTAIVALILAKWAKPRADWQAALALLAGFWAGFIAIVGFPPFPPILVESWLPYTALMVFGVMIWLGSAKPMIRFLVAILGVALLVWLHLKPLLNSWELTTWLLWAVGMGLVWLALYWAWQPVEHLEKQPELPLAMVLAGTTCSLILGLDGSVKLAQLGGVLAAASGALFLVRWLKPAIDARVMTGTVFAAIFGALLINAQIYVEVAWQAVSLAALSGLAVAVCRLPFYARWATWKRAALLLGAMFIPAALAVIYLRQTISYDEYGY